MPNRVEILVDINASEGQVEFQRLVARITQGAGEINRAGASTANAFQGTTRGATDVTRAIVSAQTQAANLTRVLGGLAKNPFDPIARNATVAGQIVTELQRRLLNLSEQARAGRIAPLDAEAQLNRITRALGEVQQAQFRLNNEAAERAPIQRITNRAAADAEARRREADAEERRLRQERTARAGIARESASLDRSQTRLYGKIPDEDDVQKNTVALQSRIQSIQQTAARLSRSTTGQLAADFEAAGKRASTLQQILGRLYDNAGSGKVPLLDLLTMLERSEGETKNLTQLMFRLRDAAAQAGRGETAINRDQLLAQAQAAQTGDLRLQRGFAQLAQNGGTEALRNSARLAQAEATRLQQRLAALYRQIADAPESQLPQLQNQLRQTQQEVNALRQRYIQAASAQTQFERGTRAASRSLGDVAKIAAGNILANFFSSAVYRARELVQESVQLNVELGRAERRLIAATQGSGTTAGRGLAQANQLRETTGASQRIATEIQASAQQFTVFAGRQAADVEKFTRAVTNLAVARGRPIEEVPRIINQLIAGVDEATDRLFGVNPSVLQEQYARSIGKTFSQLTDLEKKTALYNRVLQDGAGYANTLNAYLNTTAGRIETATNRWEDFKTQLGGVISESEVFEAVLARILELLKGIQGARGGKNLGEAEDYPLSPKDAADAAARQANAGIGGNPVVRALALAPAGIVQGAFATIGAIGKTVTGDLKGAGQGLKDYGENVLAHGQAAREAAAAQEAFNATIVQNQAIVDRLNREGRLNFFNRQTGELTNRPVELIEAEALRARYAEMAAKRTELTEGERKAGIPELAPDEIRQIIEAKGAIKRAEELEARAARLLNDIKNTDPAALAAGARVESELSSFAGYETEGAYQERIDRQNKAKQAAQEEDDRRKVREREEETRQKAEERKFESQKEQAIQRLTDLENRSASRTREDAERLVRNNPYVKILADQETAVVRVTREWGLFGDSVVRSQLAIEQVGIEAQLFEQRVATAMAVTQARFEAFQLQQERGLFELTGAEERRLAVIEKQVQAAQEIPELLDKANRVARGELSATGRQEAAVLAGLGVSDAEERQFQRERRRALGEQRRDFNLSRRQQEELQQAAESAEAGSTLRGYYVPKSRGEAIARQDEDQRAVEEMNRQARIFMEQFERLRGITTGAGGGAFSSRAQGALDQALISNYEGLPDRLRDQLARGANPTVTRSVEEAYRREAERRAREVEQEVGRGQVVEQTVRFAEAQVAALRGIQGATPEQQDVLMRQILAVTGQLDRKELTPELLQARVESLNRQAERDAQREQEAREAVKTAEKQREAMIKAIHELKREIGFDNREAVLRIVTDDPDVSVEKSVLPPAPSTKDAIQFPDGFTPGVRRPGDIL